MVISATRRGEEEKVLMKSVLANIIGIYQVDQCRWG
jgi:hypothetical protein